MASPKKKKAKKDHQTTFIARPKEMAENDTLILDEMSVLMNKAYHLGIACMPWATNISKFKTRLTNKYGITRRQAHSVTTEAGSKIEAARSNRDNQIARLIGQIEYQENLLEKIKNNEKRNKGKEHQKHRKILRLKDKLNLLRQDIEDKVVHITCGTNKLFRAQFNLDANGYNKHKLEKDNHKDWKKDWEFARTRSFPIVGSKDETEGNQTCQATANPDGTINFKLRLPNKMVEKYGKYLFIKNVKFSYGQENILAALNKNLERKARQVLETSLEKGRRLPSSEKGKYKEMGVSLSYLFKRDKNGWKIHLTTEVIHPAWVSKKNWGVIGVDINIDHLAVVEIDKYGNPIKYRNIPLSTYGLSSDQTLALVGEKVKELVNWATDSKKPIIIEKLDFKNKKRYLYKVYSKKRARMISSFAYTTITTFIKARAYRQGIHTRQVSPAYTSLLGRCREAASRYGLTIHQAAALVIGRRFLGFSEKLPSPGYIKVPVGDGTTLPLLLPDRSPRRRRKRGNISRLVATQKNLRAALAAHYQTKRNQRSEGKPKDGRKTFRSCRTSTNVKPSSESPQLVDSSTGWTPLVGVGEIPTGESLSATVGTASIQMVTGSRQTSKNRVL
jgi:IS605 OrfB family transposase